MGISEVAGTGTAPIVLGGKTYTLSAVTLIEFADAEADIKSNVRKELVANTADLGMPHLERAEYIREELSKVSIVDELKKKSKEAMMSLAYHSIKRNHPDVKRDDIFTNMTTDKMIELANCLTDIMGTNSKKVKGRAKKPAK